MIKIALARVNYSQLYGVYDEGKTYECRDILPPYQLLTLAGYIKNNDRDIRIFDGEINLQTQLELAEDILKWEPDFVGLTATTPDIDLTIEVCDILKKHNSSIITIIGGSHASAMPHDVARYSSVDHVVIGDGEEVLESIIVNQGNNKILKGKIIEIKNMPIPAHELLDYKKYTFSDPIRGLMQTASIMTTRGCPYNCNFCFHNRKLRFKNINVVINEIECLYKKGVRYFYIYDDTFLTKKKWVISVLNKIQKLDISDAHFQCLTRGNLITPSLLNLLKKTNFVRISMGIESGSDEILERAQKGVTKDDYRKSCKIIHDFNIETRGSFIVGHPYETEKDIQRTIDFSKELCLYHANFNIMTPYPGTKIYEMAKASKGIRFADKKYEITWNEYRRWGNCIIETDDLSSSDLINAQRRCQIEFYTQQKIYDYYYHLFLNGNRSFYFYRPLNFAWQQKFGKNIPFFDNLDHSAIVNPQKK